MQEECKHKHIRTIRISSEKFRQKPIQTMCDDCDKVFQRFPLKQT